MKTFIIMHVLYLGLGSNVGDRISNCEEAVRRINSVEGFEVAERSSFYETKPLGGPPQDDFINGVIKVDSDIPPEKCLSVFKEIEKAMGRKPSVKNGPRVIDIDILLYDDEVINEEEIRIPHPEMHKRGFVLKGLSEIAPFLVHPVLGKTVRELCAEVRE